jgi:hypothetical protein
MEGLSATRTLRKGRWVKDPEGKLGLIVALNHPNASIHYVQADGTTEMELIPVKDEKGKPKPGDFTMGAKERVFSVEKLTLVTNLKDIPASRR